MSIPTISKKHWALALCLCLAVVAGIALFVLIPSTNSVTPAVPLHDKENTVPPLQTLVNTPPQTITNTPEPTPTAPYKIIPRNSTYTPSKPLIEPINLNHTYTITLNPPFDDPQNPIGIHQGTIFEVSGTTDLPVGTELRAHVASSGNVFGIKRHDPCQLDVIGDGICIETRNMLGSIYVESRRSENKTCASSLNTWRFIIDSQPLRPDEFVITVDPIEAKGFTSTIIHILESPE